MNEDELIESVQKYINNMIRVYSFDTRNMCLLSVDFLMGNVRLL